MPGSKFAGFVSYPGLLDSTDGILGREYSQFGSVIPPWDTISRAQVADTPGSHGVNHTNGADGQTPYETRPAISSCASM